MNQSELIEKVAQATEAYPN